MHILPNCMHKNPPTKHSASTACHRGHCISELRMLVTCPHPRLSKKRMSLITPSFGGTLGCGSLDVSFRLVLLSRCCSSHLAMPLTPKGCPVGRAINRDGLSRLNLESWQGNLNSVRVLTLRGVYPHCFEFLWASVKCDCV